MNQKGNTLVITIISIVVLGVIGFLVYQNIQLKKQVTLPSTTPVVTPVVTSTPAATPDETANWKIYTNTLYGFEIKYPPNFQALTDKNNLYGWPKAVVLFYSGGQSYDLPVEVWNTEAEYKAKYQDTSNLTVYKTKDGRFITLINTNKDPEVDKIISTFKFTD